MALAGPPRNHENGAAAKAIFTPVPGKKRNSPKFTVASNRSDAAVSTRQQHAGTPSASKRSDLVAVVAPLRIKESRLVTMQLPEKFSPIGPGLNRTSPLRSSKKFRNTPAAEGSQLDYRHVPSVRRSCRLRCGTCLWPAPPLSYQWGRYPGTLPGGYRA
jgi:hypothetical protein